MLVFGIKTAQFGLCNRSSEFKTSKFGIWKLEFGIKNVQIALYKCMLNTNPQIIFASYLHFAIIYQNDK